MDSFAMPGNKRLLRLPATAAHTAAVLSNTFRIVFNEYGPWPELIADFAVITGLNSLQLLRHVCFEFDEEDDVEGVVGLLTLLSNRCPLLDYVGIARVGSEEPARVRLRFVSVERHLGRMTSDAMRSVIVTQQPANEMTAMLASLAGMTTLGGLQSLHLTDGFTYGDHGGIVDRTNTYDRRVTGALPMLPAAGFGNLTSLQLFHVRGGSEMVSPEQFAALPQLRKLVIGGAEDVPVGLLQQGLTELVVGMLTASGLHRALAVESLAVLQINSRDFHQSQAISSFGPWPIVRLYDEDFQHFAATCDIFRTAAERALLPEALCFWKVGGVLLHGAVCKQLRGSPRRFASCCMRLQLDAVGITSTPLRWALSPLAQCSTGGHGHRSGVDVIASASICKRVQQGARWHVCPMGHRPVHVTRRAMRCSAGRVHCGGTMQLHA